tara:strand:- start:62 stop:205 length:144 start_codon:yes stop_codon:yes gene_type:complete
MEHLELVAQAKQAIDRVFSDTTVDRETTKESLEEIQEEIVIMLDTLD